MQKLVLWQISEFNPLMRATCEAREQGRRPPAGIGGQALQEERD